MNGTKQTMPLNTIEVLLRLLTLKHKNINENLLKKNEIIDCFLENRDLHSKAAVELCVQQH